MELRQETGRHGQKVRAGEIIAPEPTKRLDIFKFLLTIVY
jgi:hypothetical protein